MAQLSSDVAAAGESTFAPRRARPRRSSPGSGLMIIFGVLMLGMAMAIPASQAIQEANMRDRLASFGGGESSASTDAAPERPALIESSTPSTPSGNGSESSKAGQAVVAGEELDDEEVTASHEEEVESSMPKPTHLRIPSVEIDSEIVPVTSHITEVNGQRVREWDVASYAAGHHDTSARPGEGGNTVITGHNDWEGEVFRTLEHVEVGDLVYVESEAGEFRYVIEEVHLRREVGVSMEERLATGQFMAPMPDERVTLITCWPYGINDHRVIVVAKPI